MKANLDQYTKEELIVALHDYMRYVGYEEGTTFVNRYSDKEGNVWRHPNEELNEMTKATVDILHAVDEALLE